jgi:hypothetical protein
MKPGHAPQAVADRLGDPQILGAGLSLRVRPHLQRADLETVSGEVPSDRRRTTAETPFPRGAGRVRADAECPRPRKSRSARGLAALIAGATPTRPFFDSLRSCMLVDMMRLLFSHAYTEGRTLPTRTVRSSARAGHARGSRSRGSLAAQPTCWPSAPRPAAVAACVRAGGVEQVVGWEDPARALSSVRRIAMTSTSSL